MDVNKIAQFIPVVARGLAAFLRRKSPNKKPPRSLRVWAAQSRAKQEALDKLFGKK